MAASATATAPPAPNGNANSAPAALPFQLSSRKMTRFSYNIGATALSASALTQLSPIQLPAEGYLSHLDLEVTVTGAGGTSPAFTADAPFNVISSVNLRTAAGNDIIAPLTGYQLYGINKYGCQYTMAPFSDARMGYQYSAVAPSAHFFTQIPLEINSGNALGAVPNLASNRSYQLMINFAAISTVCSGSPSSMSVAINMVAHYWSAPPPTNAAGVPQSTTPAGNGTLSQWSVSQYPLTPGDKYITLASSVGNVLRTLIFTLRNSSGVRTGSDWPAVCELYLDNEPIEYYPVNNWQDDTQKRYHFTGTSLDAASSLDTGVFVIPFYALAGGIPGDPRQPNSQLLPTMDASQLQIRGTSWGAGASTLEVITNSVIPASASTLYNV